jgi:predicted house-cleaning noncanonical NTP pyrophosphatase (MazG superfamily)
LSVHKSLHSHPFFLNFAEILIPRSYLFMASGELVRDKIPELIKTDRKLPRTHKATEEEYGKLLKKKLKKEVDEFLEAECREEMADVWEVLYAMCEFRNWSKKDIEDIRKKKAEKKGDFKNRVVLDGIDNP